MCWKRNNFDRYITWQKVFYNSIRWKFLTSVSINDTFCEEKSSSFASNWKTSLSGKALCNSAIKYFNQRLLNYIQKFSSGSDYLFFVHWVIQKLNINSFFNIAMKKDASNKQLVWLLVILIKRWKDFISSDRAFTFVNCIKGTTAY